MNAYKIEINNDKILQLPDLLHCIRVSRLALLLCDEMKISGSKKDEINISALLHDIGKSMLDQDILNKEEKLSHKDWSLIKLHAEFGGMIARMVGLNEEIVKNIVYHHENYDGTGYPRKLSGEKIPLGAAIIRICDSYDALRMKRPYKEAYSHEKTIEEILLRKDWYNPHVLEKFISIKPQYLK